MAGEILFEGGDLCAERPGYRLLTTGRIRKQAIFNFLQTVQIF